MNTHRMLFTGTDFNPGANLTIRAGKKWHDRVDPGDELQLVKTGEEDRVIGTAEVLMSCVTSLSGLPDSWLRFEHAAGARTRDGLIAAMNRAYGAGNWEQEITCLFFWY